MRTAAAKIHHTAAVPTTRHRLVATTTMAAGVNINSTAAVRTKSRRRKDRNSKDADANTINSVAAPMALRLHKDHMATAVIVRNASTNAVPTALQRPLDPTSKDAHAPPVNLAAAPMASPMPKDRTSMAATTFRLHRKRLAVSRKTAAPAAITRSNTSSIWNMEVARASGTAAAVAMTIATIQLKTANRRARLRPEKMRAYCRKSMGPALATIQFITTILIAMLARNSFMVDAWATPTDSKPSTNVKNCAKSTISCVSWERKRASQTFAINFPFSDFPFCTEPCDQPVEAGQCHGQFERWHYDKEQDTCVPFTYGGCKGNKNNFASKEACSYQCKRPGSRKGKRRNN